jgi:osmotically-inducible protein OsmY
LAERALAARVRAILKATPATAHVELDVQADGESVRLAGVVGSEAARDAALTVAREVRGVSHVSTDVKVFRRPIR